MKKKSPSAKSSPAAAADADAPKTPKSTEATADSAEAAAAPTATQDGTSPDAATEAAEDTIQQQLEAAMQEAASHKENYLRMAAELENLRRRSEKKITEAHQFALTDFALAVGEVRDCLEAALADASAEADKMREGVDLTLRKLVAAMDTRHILPIQPDIGAAFDPAIHMAIGQMPATPQAQADTVGAVVQAGYMLNGRVIRAATVMVAVDATAEEDSTKTEKPAKK